ncbi:HNH endonuclease, partial [Acinetobacter baumannii]|uniref:HNH endonuclease n=1 Tax=Acinetobacter baumannii TaxID=470 RepID=UPI0039F0CC56
MNQNNTEAEVNLFRFTFHFITQNTNSFFVSVEGPDENETLINFVNDMYRVLYASNVKQDLDPAHPNQIKASALQRMTPSLRTQVNAMLSDYTKLKPSIHKAISKLNSIEDDEYFFVFPYEFTEKMQAQMLLQTFLRAKNSLNSDEEVNQYMQTHMEGFNSLFDDLLEKYNIAVFGETERRTVIGQKPTKEHGVCRFCKSPVDENTTFRKVAHTISEALGNKSIVTADECDTCNERFGRDYEPHLIQYLDILRVYYGTRGKKGIPHLKFKNGQVFQHKQEGSEENSIVIASQDIVETENGLIVSLSANQKVNKLKIFKSLCKYAISVLPAKELPAFESTIEWLFSDPEIGEEKQQFHIAKMYGQSYAEHPELTLYTRISDTDPEWPHVVADFKLGTLHLIFILPFSKKDASTFNLETDFQKLSQLFRHYQKFEDQIIFENLSNSEERECEYKVRFSTGKIRV